MVTRFYPPYRVVKQHSYSQFHSEEKHAYLNSKKQKLKIHVYCNSYMIKYSTAVVLCSQFTYCQNNLLWLLMWLTKAVLVQVNGHDLTMATHKKAVEYIGRKPVLNLLVYRKGMPQLQPRPAPHQSTSYQSYPAGYRQQQQPIAQSSSASQPYYRQYWLPDFTTCTNFVTKLSFLLQLLVISFRAVSN